MRVLPIVLAAVALSGCLHSSTVIRVQPDGSGTIEQTLMFNPQNIEKAFAGMGLKPSGGSKSTSKITTEDEAKKDLGRLGDGVTLVSIRPVKQEDGFEGVAVSLAFDDITTLRTEEFLMPGPAGAEKTGGALDGIRFTFARSPEGISMLTATFHETPAGGSSASKGPKSGKSSKAGQGGPDVDDPDVRQMLKAMFKGFRIGVDLELSGQIVRTNADYVQGKRITLAEIDIEALIRDSKKLEALDKVLKPDASIAQVRPYLKDVKGLKINHPVVTVEFK